MAEEIKENTPNIIIELSNRKFVLYDHQVMKMISLEKIQQTPSIKPYQLGMIVHGKEMFSCIDLRHFLGMISIEQEAQEKIDSLNDMLLYYKKWYTDLITSLKEKKDFIFEKSYKQTAFYQWYKNFKTENLALNQQLALLEYPHKQIHETTQACLELSMTNQEEALKKTAAEEQDLLAQLNRVIESTKLILLDKTQRVGIIALDKTRHYCFVVDNILAVRVLSIEKEEAYIGNPYIEASLKEIKSDEILHRLNMNNIFQELVSIKG